MADTDRFDARPKVKRNRLNVLPANPENASEDKPVGLGRFPSWLHRKLPQGSALWQTGEILGQNRLHTVCEEAKCPNLLECWSRKTATFLIMGKECTRSCGFCSIDFSKNPKPLEEDEPERVAKSVVDLGLKHVVITMVARDDLEDGGAAQIAKVVRKIRENSPQATIELLTSDFCGKEESLQSVLNAYPEIFNHNIETVRDMTPWVRHKATYDRTLQVLNFAKKNRGQKMLIKSGLMVGLGESSEQVRQTLRDLAEAGCDIVTIGQYLQASSNKLRVKSFVHPDQFKEYEKFGLSIGIQKMYCGPFVRSSYNADLFV